MGGILVLNSGSSSIKFALFDESLDETLSGSATEIGGASDLKISSKDLVPRKLRPTCRTMQPHCVRS
jgi:acetate kinase